MYDKLYVYSVLSVENAIVDIFEVARAVAKKIEDK